MIDEKRARVREEQGPAPSEGAPRATGEGAGSSAARGALADGQRWSGGRKREVVLRMLRGESLDGLSRELGVEIHRLEEWREQAMAGLDAGLRALEDQSGRSAPGRSPQTPGRGPHGE
jgi:hypothetical protein